MIFSSQSLFVIFLNHNLQNSKKYPLFFLINYMVLPIFSMTWLRSRTKSNLSVRSSILRVEVDGQGGAQASVGTPTCWSVLVVCRSDVDRREVDCDVFAFHDGLTPSHSLTVFLGAFCGCARTVVALGFTVRAKLISSYGIEERRLILLFYCAISLNKRLNETETEFRPRLTRQSKYKLSFSNHVIQTSSNNNNGYCLKGG